MTDALAPRPDIRDMANVHQVFRDAVANGPRLIGTVTVGDTDRSGHVGSYYLNVLDLLKSHHEGEDHLMTPLLLERCSAQEAAMVSQVAAQHELVHQPVVDADAAIQAWKLTADPDDAATSLALLQGVDEALLPHLDREEAEVMPLVTEHLSLEEWGELPKHGIANFKGDNLWLIVGLIRETMSKDQLATMDANMPPPVVEAWHAVGQSEFTTFVTELRA